MGMGKAVCTDTAHVVITPYYHGGYTVDMILLFAFLLASHIVVYVIGHYNGARPGGI